MVAKIKILPVTNGNYGSFPKENVDPRVKAEKPWLIQFFRAALGTYIALPSRTVGYQSRDRYEKIRKYGLARQPFQPYRDLMEMEVDHPELGMHSLMVSERIVPVMVKPRAIVTSLIEKANENYDIQLEPIDSQAAGDMLDQRNELKAKVLLRHTLRRAGHPALANAAPVAQTPGEPDDLEGAHIAVLGIRHKAAIKAELTISHVLNYNNFEQRRCDIAADLTDYGAAYMRDDTCGCMVTTRKGDMSRLIVSPFTDPQGEDIWYAGELVDMPLNKVIADSDGYITEDELKAVFDIASGAQRQEIFGCGNNWSWNRVLGQGRVQVLDMELISSDTDVREERTNKYGNYSFGKADFAAQDSEGVKIYRKRTQNVYTGKWVVGTEIMYRYGAQVDQKRDPRNPRRAMLSYHFAFGHMENMDAYSITENMIPFADSIQMRRIKMEHMFNTAIPKGFQINLSALEEIAIDAAGKQKMSPKDILGLLFSRGIVLYRGESLLDDQGKPLDVPVKETVTTIGNELVQYWNDILQLVQMMYDTIGLNENTDATSPDAKRSNPATAAAINGTKNALSKVFGAEKYMTLALSQSILIRAQTLMKTGRGDEFITGLGASTVAFMKGAPALDAHRFGYKIVDRPTQEQLEQFEAELAEAMKQGSLDVGDLAYIRSLRNLKERTEYLVYKCRKNKDESRQFEMQKIKTTTDQQTASAQAAEKAKQETLQIQYKLMAEYKKTEADLDMRNDKQNGLFMLEGKRIDATGRTDSSYVQAKGRDATNARDNITKLVEQGHDDKVPQINIPADLKTDIAPLASEQQPLPPGIAELEQMPFSFLGNPLGSSNASPQAAPPPTGQEQQPGGADPGATPDEAPDEQESPEEASAPGEESAEGGGVPSEQDLMQMLGGGAG